MTICEQPSSCGTRQEQESIVDQFETNLDNLLSQLIVWRKKLYIHLVQLFGMSSVVQHQSWRCMVFAQDIHECPCMHQGTENATRMDHVTDRMNLVLEQLAEKYDHIRPDIGVNLLQTYNQVPIPDPSYLSALDCFRPSAKTHQRTAHALWNAMLQPSVPTPMSDIAAFVPLCANATSRVVTWKDQKKKKKEKKLLLRGD